MNDIVALTQAKIGPWLALGWTWLSAQQMGSWSANRHTHAQEDSLEADLRENLPGVNFSGGLDVDAVQEHSQAHLEGYLQ